MAVEADNSTSSNIPPGRSLELGPPPNLPTTDLHSPAAFKSSTAVSDQGRPGKRPRLESPIPMTAAAAMAVARDRSSKSPGISSPQTSPNPQAEALGALLGVSQQPTSRADDLRSNTVEENNPATTLSQPMAIVAENLKQTRLETGGMSGDNLTQTSPVSVSSLVTLDGHPHTSGIASTTVGSPLPMEGMSRPTGVNTDSTSPEDDNKAFSYPAPLLQPHTNDASRRGMSLPHSGLRQGTRSPSSKKHKCPYCSTEFTRHHNLKSHLLTHSQEKPYVCSTCSSKFRRLHDLKRHMKLHTGERPHVCPKCNRKFARGDALARHNKGPGGCAGRRASLGSFGGDDEDGDDMEGVVYGEPEAMDDDESGVRGTPQIRRHAPSGDDSTDGPQSNYRIPSTYPPIQGRPPASMAGGTHPLQPNFIPSHQAPSQSGVPQPYNSSGSLSNLRSAPGPQVFAQNPVSESPQPISPAQRKNTAPGLYEGGGYGTPRLSNNSQYTHQLSHPPRGSSTSNSLTVPPHGPQLPPPHTLNPPDPRFTLPSQGPTHPPTGPSGPPTHMSGSGPLSSHSNSSSHGHSGHGSGEGHKSVFPTNEERLWAIVRTMEQQMSNMSETINALREEVSGLRNIITQQTRTSSGP